MQHILLTRFNLSSEHYHKGNTPTWLGERFEIFENFCLPSVKHQTFTNFKWIIFFDINTPQDYRLRALRLADENSFISILLIDGFAELNRSCSDLIMPFITEDFVITTRLDNDDIIHRDFIKSIADVAKPHHRMVIDLQSGYQMIFQNDKYTFRQRISKFNQFISVVENSKQFKSVLSQEHHSWMTEEKVASVTKPQLWIEFVHGKNVANAANFFALETAKICLDDFQLKGLNLAFTSQSILIKNILKYPLTLAYRFYKNVQLTYLKQRNKNRG